MTSENELILQGMAQAFNRIERVLTASAFNLQDLLDGRLVPDAFAKELASVVGFSDDLRIAGRVVTPADWRRMIQLAPTIWSNKGGHDVIRDVVRALAAARTWIGDWFGLRVVAGVTVFPWLMAESIVDSGEYWTEFHVEDADATLDLDFAADAFDLMRAIGERFNLTFVRMVENWDELFRWVDLDTGVSTVSGNILTLDATSDPIMLEWSVAPTLWTDVVYNALVHVADGGTLTFRFRGEEGGDAYEVALTHGGTPDVDLLKDGGSVATGTAGFWSVPAAATGSITVVAGGSLIDGEDFTIDDGVGVSLDFEFDSSGGVSAGAVTVPFTGAETADQIRDLVIAAVNAQDLFAVTAANGGAGLVDLTHDQNTHQGNIFITETVADAGFVVTGMGGGVPETGVLLSVRTVALGSGDLQIEVVINGTVIITYTDATPRTTQFIGWSCAAGLHQVLWCEVVPINASQRVLE